MIEFWNAITDFITKNWDNILVSIVTGVVFFILGPLGLWFSNKKIRREKTIKAQDQLLDLVESMLVNKESINTSKLSSIFYAIGRRNNVNLEFETDLNNILEDLTLRFASSKHLSATQKDEYIDKIQLIITEIHKEEGSENISTEPKTIPKTYKRIIEEIESKISENNIDSAKSSLEELKEKLSITGELPISRMFNSYFKLYKRNPILFFVVSIIVIVFYIWFISTVIIK
jgi:hypothetical protein